MANYALVHRRISKGRGKAAKVVGQVFTVTRLTSAGFITLSPNMRCLLRKSVSHRDQEQRFFTPQIFELVCDVRALQVGDLLEEAANTYLAQPRYSVTNTDPDVFISGVSVVQSYAPIYYVAQIRPVHKFIGVRMESLCQVRRSIYPTANGDNGWQQEGENAEAVLTLPVGASEFQYQAVNYSGYPPDESTPVLPAPVPVLIPMQIEPAYSRGTPPFNLPMDWGIGKWHFTCPAGGYPGNSGFPSWSNFRLREGDIVIAPDGGRYRVFMIFDSHIGPTVQQGVLEKAES